MIALFAATLFIYAAMYAVAKFAPMNLKKDLHK